MNCPKCTSPMKEYLGLRETGWDCTNRLCGQGFVEVGIGNTVVSEWKPFTVPKTGVYKTEVKIFMPPPIPAPGYDDSKFPLPSDVSNIFYKSVAEWKTGFGTYRRVGDSVEISWEPVIFWNDGKTWRRRRK